MYYYPPVLKKGDELRIIAPSRSRKILSTDGIVKAQQRLEGLGFHISFGQFVDSCDLQQSSSIEDRINDLHEAFTDPHVKGILTVIGGYNSNELLPYIDYELIQNNPKMLCGYSDITALATAITAKTNMITFSGPHFSSFQMDGLQHYQSTSFLAAVMQHQCYTLAPSTQWSDDLWFLDDVIRQYEATEWKCYTEGNVSGILFGGNLCTLNLLQGTCYFPKLENSILFIEDDELTNPETFARDLASLLQTTTQIKGLMIGRFQRASNVTEEQLLFILNKHPQLKHLPVMYNVDFGHTQPIMTLPIGATIAMNTQLKQITVKR